MDVVTLLLYFCQALVALCFAAMIGYGLRRLADGRLNLYAVAAFALALAVFAIAYALADASGYPPAHGEVVTRGEAALTYAAVVMFVLAMGALVVSAARGALR